MTGSKSGEEMTCQWKHKENRRKRRGGTERGGRGQRSPLLILAILLGALDRNHIHCMQEGLLFLVG